MWQSWKESTRRRFYRGFSCSHCSSVVTSSCKGCETDTSLKMVKEFVLIEHEEYNQDDVSKTTNASMLPIQQLLNAVKSRVRIMHHNKVENLFEFLKTHPSILLWTDFGKAIVDGI